MVEEGYEFSHKVPKFFSETRFANYASRVYNTFRYLVQITRPTNLPPGRATPP
jgi:hypothetical protein